MHSIGKLKIYEPINPKLRLILIGLGLVTVMGISIWLAPYPLSLYYQLKGGQMLAKAYDTANLAGNIACRESFLKQQKARIQVSSAVLQLHKAIEYNQMAHSYLLLGRAHCLLGEPSKAIEAYQVFNSLRPDNPLGYLELGFAYELSGDEKSAINEWKKIPSVAQDFLRNGDIALRQNDLDAALKWYERATWVDPKNENAWIGLGNTYVELKKAQEAVFYFHKAWELKGESGTTPLSQTLIRLGDHQEVEKILRQALEVYTTSQNRLQWWRMLGQSVASQNNWGEAVGVYEKAVEEFPKDIDLHISLGWAYYEGGDGFILAQRELEKALELNRDIGKPYYEIGQLMYREGKYIEAEYWFRKATEIAPHNLWYRVWRGNAARSADNVSLAIDIYRAIINDDPDYDRAYHELALAYQIAERTDEAKIAIKRAIQLTSTPSQWYYIRAGEIYEDAGDTETALNYFQKALKLDPSNSSARRWIQRLEN